MDWIIILSLAFVASVIVAHLSMRENVKYYLINVNRIDMASQTSSGQTTDIFETADNPYQRGIEV